MAKIKITHADRYDALVDLVKKYGVEVTKGEGEDAVTEGAEEMIAFLNSRKEKLGAKAEKTSSKKNDEYIQIEDNIVAILDGKMSLADITKAYNEKYGTEFTTQKVMPRLSALVADGKVVKETKKKKVVFYLA